MFTSPAAARTQLWMQSHRECVPATYSFHLSFLWCVECNAVAIEKCSCWMSSCRFSCSYRIKIMTFPLIFDKWMSTQYSECACVCYFMATMKNYTFDSLLRLKMCRRQCFDVMSIMLHTNVTHYESILLKHIPHITMNFLRLFLHKRNIFTAAVT